MASSHVLVNRSSPPRGSGARQGPSLETLQPVTSHASASELMHTRSAPTLALTRDDHLIHALVADPRAIRGTVRAAPPRKRHSGRPKYKLSARPLPNLHAGCANRVQRTVSRS